MNRTNRMRASLDIALKLIQNETQNKQLNNSYYKAIVKTFKRLFCQCKQRLYIYIHIFGLYCLFVISSK